MGTKSWPGDETVSAEPGQTLTVLWYWTTGPRTKTVTVTKLTAKQIVTVDENGLEERFWRNDGEEVAGVAKLMTADHAAFVVESWHAKDAQRRAVHAGRPVAVSAGGQGEEQD